MSDRSSRSTAAGHIGDKSERQHNDEGCDEERDHLALNLMPLTARRVSIELRPRQA